jgi:hypothetical protein
MATAPAPWEKYSQESEESGPWQKYGSQTKAETAPNHGLPEGELPLDSYTNATLQGFANIGKGAIGAVEGAYNTVRHPLATARSILSLPGQATQVPSAIKDINASADPIGTYAKVAGETAGEGAGQAIVGAATPEIPGMARDVIQGIGPKTKALAKVGAQAAISRVPIAGWLVRRPSIWDYMQAVRAKAPAISTTAEESGIPTAELQEKISLPDPTVERARGLGLLERARGRPASETGKALATIPAEMDRVKPLPDHVVAEKTAIPTSESAKGLGLVRQKNIPPASQNGEALGMIPTPGQLAMRRLRPLSDEQLARAISLPSLDDIKTLPPRLEGSPATTMRVAQPGLERPVTENPVVGGLVRAMQESGLPIAKRPNLLLKGAGRVNRILGPEEDLSDILAKSLRQVKRQKEQ